MVVTKFVSKLDIIHLFNREKSYFPRATPYIREIWRFVHRRKVIFPESNARGKYDYFEGEQIFISHLCKGNKCVIPPGERFGEFCQMKSFGHLCLQNYYFGTSLESIPLYDQGVKSWEFRIREIRYCWEGNYDVVEREIRCFDKCHVGLFRPIEFLYK